MIASLAILLALTGTPQQAGHDDAAVQQPAQPAVEQAAEQHGVTPEVGHGATAEEHGGGDGVDFMHHILDSHEWETPFGVVHFPEPGSWMVGPIDMTPTKHVLFFAIAATLAVLLLLTGASLAARAERGRTAGRRHNLIEALVLYIRNEVVMKNIGHGGEKFAPFLLTLFFVILFANLLGLIPWGSTATANVSVTAVLAVLVFLVTEISGMRAQGAGYLSTIFYWNKDLALPMRVLLFLIMTPVEFIGKLTKPFSLAIRLMANMTAGHIVLLAIISLIFVFASWAVVAAPVLMAVAITFLEIFVSFLQAYIFTLLSSVFIGLMQHAHH
ncbi:MAG TPA: F0F1 ATP synthase subunit A [Longimicrobiaceae bacterium]|nr:F0F1 ATP synthase subunit A [Longimicrobiaceae bacterium]